MIVSGIWWKRVEGPLKTIALVPLLLLGGCGLEQFLLGGPPAPEQSEPLPPSRSDGPQVDVSAGLSPLLTPQQVLTAVPFGRSDPFAPLPAPAIPAVSSGTGTPSASPQAAPAGAAGAPGGASAPGGAPADAAAAAQPPSTCTPEGLRLTGVIRSGGSAEALVTNGSLSGSLRVGDRGGRSTDLLPAGCVVASIHFGGFTPGDPPAITLRRGSLKQQVKLL